MPALVMAPSQINGAAPYEDGKRRVTVWNPETGKKLAVPGCNIFVGGRIGEDAHLALEPYKKGIPLADEELIPELIEIIKNEFGGVEK